MRSVTRTIVPWLASTAPLTGCTALGLTNRQPGTPAPPMSPTPASPSSVTDVVTWGLAVVIGSLVLAFAARVLNARRKES